MAGFVKLDAGILNSTLWMDREAREIFITALLMAEPHEIQVPIPQLEISSLDATGWDVPPGWYGFIPAASVGIIHRAGVTPALGMEAMKRLGSPEPESRSKDHDGRRLVRVDGGFIVLNFIKYRDRDYTAKDRVRRWRERQKKAKAATAAEAAGTETRNETTVTRNITQAEAEAEAEIRKRERADPEQPAPQDPVPAIGKGLTIWRALTWKNRFGDAWVAKYGGVSYGGGVDASKVCGTLDLQLDALPAAERIKAQARASAMFAKYFSDRKLTLQKHPFKWFVDRFDTLRTDGSVMAPALREPESSRPEIPSYLRGKPGGG